MDASTIWSVPFTERFVPLVQDEPRWRSARNTDRFPMLDAATSIQAYDNRSGGASFGLRGLARAIIWPFSR
jgi:hypothetical protein